MAKFFTFLALATALTLLAFTFWRYLGERGWFVLMAICLIATLAENRRLRRILAEERRQSGADTIVDKSPPGPLF